VAQERKPKWSDEEAVVKWIIAIIDEDEQEAEREFYMRYANCDVPDPRVDIGKLFREAESHAAARARLGDFEPLEGLLRPDSPLVRFCDAMGLKSRPFGPETWTLIADRTTNKFKPPRGRPPEDVEYWIEQWPFVPPVHRAAVLVHGAAVETERLAHILRYHYGEKEQGVHERAMTIAARRGGDKTRKTRTLYEVT
jgi:hypothetical protein